MIDRRVARDEVEQYPDPSPFRLLDEHRHVLVRPVARGDTHIVGDVVAGVAKRGHETRIEPDRVDPQPLQVVQMR